MSHPTRVRGSKHAPPQPLRTANRVAPHAGAWIETCAWRRLRLNRWRRTPRGCVDRNLKPSGVSLVPSSVAPHAGAWIETHHQTVTRWPVRRRTPRGCVDRNFPFADFECLDDRRTPRGCVDRNSSMTRGRKAKPTSHPTRVRGSKRKLRVATRLGQTSHPTRVRGSKPCRLWLPLPTWPVAPHAGAWIETTQQARLEHCLDVAPHAGAWIETGR